MRTTYRWWTKEIDHSFGKLLNEWLVCKWGGGGVDGWKDYCYLTDSLLIVTWHWVYIHVSKSGWIVVTLLRIQPLLYIPASWIYHRTGMAELDTVTRELSMPKSCPLITRWRFWIKFYFWTCMCWMLPLECSGRSSVKCWTTRGMSVSSWPQVCTMPALGRPD